VVIDPWLVRWRACRANTTTAVATALITLGRLGIPGALPALVERLKLDEDTDVRIAAATASATSATTAPRSTWNGSRSTIRSRRSVMRRRWH